MAEIAGSIPAGPTIFWTKCLFEIPLDKRLIIYVSSRQLWHSHNFFINIKGMRAHAGFDA